MVVMSAGTSRPTPEFLLSLDLDVQMIVVFEAELFTWDARRHDTWIFVSLPVAASEEIRARTGGVRRGFGSRRVRVTIGATTWTTSIFPDSARNAYVLAVKRAVRQAESLDAGDVTEVTVELLDR
jgi:hypothetical protein